MNNFFIKTLVITAIIANSFAPIILAASSQSTFTTRLTTFGTDTSAPSVPTGLLATPMSTSQIDLTWNASIDDFAVEGYQIFRDGVNIATTSLTTFSDTGLAASTLYSYTVNAFDASYNYSAQSAPSATTTFEEVVVVPPPPATTTPVTGGGGGSGSSTILTISSVVITPDFNDADVSFETNLATQARISWGTTADLESGSLFVPLYLYNHQVRLTGLMADTFYHLRIEVTAASGATTYAEASFRTNSEGVIASLSNPTNFRARPVLPAQINLTWNNPKSSLFDYVRILRSDSFFPRDPNDSSVIYQGRAENFIDRDVIAGKMYYYTIFARGTDGAFTSGAIAQARLPLPGEKFVAYTDPFANLPQAKIVDPMIGALTLTDFDFYQEGRILPQVAGGTVAINGAETLTVKLAYDKVPEILKTIAFTLSDPHDPSAVFTFLLRVNADKTAYEATVGALGRSGQYKMSVNILDYKNQGLKRLDGDIRALVFAAPIEEIANDPLSVILVAIFGLFTILVVSMLRRKYSGTSVSPVRPQTSDSPWPSGLNRKFAGAQVTQHNQDAASSVARFLNNNA